MSLAKATLAITEDPVTTGIEKKLPWLLTPGMSAAIIPYTRPATYDRSTVEGKLEYNDFWERFSELRCGSIVRREASK